MTLQDVTEIVETSNKEQANDFLELGWILLNTVSQHDGDAGWITYSLGWPKPLPPAYPANLR